MEIVTPELLFWSDKTLDFFSVSLVWRRMNFLYLNPIVKELYIEILVIHIPPSLVTHTAAS